MTYGEILQKLKTHNLYMGDKEVKKVSKESGFYWHLFTDEVKPAIITPNTFAIMLKAKALRWKEKLNPMKELGWEKESVEMYKNKDSAIFKQGKHWLYRECWFKDDYSPFEFGVEVPTPEAGAILHANMPILKWFIQILSQKVFDPYQLNIDITDHGDGTSFRFPTPKLED